MLALSQPQGAGLDVARPVAERGTTGVDAESRGAGVVEHLRHLGIVIGGAEDDAHLRRRAGVDLELQFQAGAAHLLPGPLGAIAQVGLAEVTLIVAQHVQFGRRAQAQRAVVAEPQHAGQRHRARPRTGTASRVAAAIEDPRPHDAPAAVVDQTLGSEEGVVDPTHASVRLGSEPQVCVAAHIILAPQVVADEQQQVAVARRPALGGGGQREEVGTHVVFVGLRPLAPGGVEFVQIFPLPQVVGNQQVQRVALVPGQLTLLSVLAQDEQVPRQDVVAAVFDPDGRRIRGAIDDLVTVVVAGGAQAGLSLADHRVVGAFGPRLQQVVGAGGDADAAGFTQPPVGNGGHAMAIQGGAAGKNAGVAVSGLQGQRVLSPVHQVYTRDVGEAVSGVGLHDVHQVIAASPEQGGIGVEGGTVSFGSDDVVGGAVAVGEQGVAQGARRRHITGHLSHTFLPCARLDEPTAPRAIE